MIEQRVSTSPPASFTGRHGWRVALVGLLLLGVSALAFKAVTLAWAGWQVYQSAMQLRALAVTEAVASPTALQRSLARVADDYDHFAGELAPLLPVVAQFGFIPDYGPLATAAPELVTAGRQALALAETGGEVLLPTFSELRAAQPDAAATDLLLQTVAAQASALPQLAPGLSALRTTLATIDGAGLPTQWDAALQASPSLLTLAEAATQLGPQLPALLGMDRPKTYLVLIQNNHELRATGGFIAAIGRITLDKGKLTDLDFVDSYAIYRTDGLYPPAPAAMQTYMNIPVLVMRDANWSPDLPTAAQVARTLYKSDTGIEVDGIATIDLHAVRRLFGALGEMQVEGFETPITGDNIEEQIVKLWERPAESSVAVGGDTEEALGEWWSQRKEFIPRLVDAAMRKLEDSAIDYFAAGAAVAEALEERSIQVWLAQEEAAAVLAAQGWDGALRPEADQDFLAVIDTNMGYNKVDAAIERALDYRVAWPQGADQPAQATLTLTYTHPVDADDPGCDLTPRYGDSYADLIARCYFAYVRVYAPAGSKLIEATGVDAESVATQRGERRTSIFTGYFILPPRNTNVVTFTYTLPPRLTPDAYRLRIQRQSGTGPLPATVVIDDVRQTPLIAGATWEWPETATP